MHRGAVNYNRTVWNNQRAIVSIRRAEGKALRQVPSNTSGAGNPIKTEPQSPPQVQSWQPSAKWPQVT